MGRGRTIDKGFALHFHSDYSLAVGTRANAGLERSPANSCILYFQNKNADFTMKWIFYHNTSAFHGLMAKEIHGTGKCE